MDYWGGGGGGRECWPPSQIIGGGGGAGLPLPTPMEPTSPIENPTSRGIS